MRRPTPRGRSEPETRLISNIQTRTQNRSVGVVCVTVRRAHICLKGLVVRKPLKAYPFRINGPLRSLDTGPGLEFCALCVSRIEESVDLSV